MGTWGEIERELIASRQGGGPPDFDGVRRRYLRDLANHTGRSCIVYETAGFAPPEGAPPQDLQISLEPDLAAFMETVHGLPKGEPLDLILHSPGGTAEAAEAIVEYLRQRFSGLRVIVPVAAMSAATMMAMAADEIVMGAHSQLGPIDPQLTISTPEGPRFAPAEAIRQQFAEAQADLAKHPEHTAAWLPILRSYAPALLQLCEHAALLSKSMVEQWLSRYMFSTMENGGAKAAEVAAELSNYRKFMSHGRRIDRTQLRAFGLNIVDLEDDAKLQDLLLSVHHAISHTMNQTGTTKLIENNNGKAFIRRTVRMMVPVSQPSPPGQPGGPVQPSPGPRSPLQQPALGGPASGNRAQRRAATKAQRKKGR